MSLAGLYPLHVYFHSPSTKPALIGFLAGFSVFAALILTFNNFNLHNDSPVFSSPKLTHAPCPTSSSTIPRGGCEEGDGGDKEDRDRWELLLSMWDDFIKNETQPHHTSTLFPKPPYWQNCSEKAAHDKALDTRGTDGSPPPWSLWKGNLHDVEDDSLRGKFDHVDLEDSNITPRPPWVEGGDADNYPLTRRVQQDLWLHQHPPNCSDPGLRFMWVSWENGAGFGLGARIKCMLAFFAIAVRENRILVSDSFGRADHAGCEGDRRNQWDCYFLPETTKECKMRALELRSQPEAVEKGIIVDKSKYSWGDMWNSPISNRWGSPWDYMQTTVDVHGKLIRHPASDRRWWRAQAIRYMMRFPSEYTCRLMNQARHQYFGPTAARAMLSTLPSTWPKIAANNTEGDMERIIWGSRAPWIPRPMISMHVRLGDKAREMEMVPYTKYMDLASRIRSSFPDATNIWLATEMEDVIEESKNHKDWNIYYTNITRQTGTISMFEYEQSIGMEASTNNGFVNFLMALESDFFIGPLGSTWSLLLDCMRATGGKLMSGFLSVNLDTFW